MRRHWIMENILQQPILFVYDEGFLSCVYLFISVTIYSKSFLCPSSGDVYTQRQHRLWPSPHRSLTSSRLCIPTRATLISPRPSRPCVPRLCLPVMFSSARLVHHNGCLCLPSSLWPSPSPSRSLSLSPSWAGSCLSASLINTKTNCSRLEVCSVGRSC